MYKFVIKTITGETHYKSIRKFKSVSKAQEMGNRFSKNTNQKAGNYIDIEPA